MDRIAELLKAWAYDQPGYNLGFNSVVTIVKGTSIEEFDTPGEAVEEAQRFVESLTDDRYALANRASLGASCEPIDWDSVKWRAHIDVVLVDRGDIEEAPHMREIPTRPQS